MQEVRDRVRLVDPSEIGAREIQTVVSRAEIQNVLDAKDGEPELVIDVTRSGEAEARTLRLAFDPTEVEELLRRTDGEKVTLTFDGSALEQAIEDDVAAHGLRERAVVLAVAATTAAAGASVAQAAVYQTGGSGSATTPAASSVVSEHEWPVGAAADPTGSAAAVNQGAVSEREWPVGAAAAGPAESAAPAAANQGVVSEREWPVGAAAAGPAESAAPAAANQGVVSEREWPVGVQESATPGPVSEREWPVAVSGAAVQAQAPSVTPATPSASGGTDAATAAAVAGGAVLLISAAGFAVRRQRKIEPEPA